MINRQIDARVEKITQVGKIISDVTSRLEEVSIALLNRISAIAVDISLPICSYAAVTAPHVLLYSMHMQIIAKSDHKQCMITFEWTEANSKEAKDLSEKELILKAEIVLEVVRKSE